MILLLVGALVPAFGGVLTLFVPARGSRTVFAVFACVAAAVVLPVSIGVLLSGASLSITVALQPPFGDATIAMDPLSALFAVVIALGGAFGAIFSTAYMASYDHGAVSMRAYHLFFGLLVSSMLLLVVVQHALLFLVAWEIMSFSSAFLVMAERDSDEARSAGVYYLGAMQLGVAFLIAGFAWAAVRSGNYSFAAFGALPVSARTGIFAVLCCGFAMKAGLVPFHTWLPKAHPAAPTAVSALMSGVMIKTGIYGMLRIVISLHIASVNIGLALFAVGLLSGLMGIANAIAQRDMKRLLAYSSIENIGIITMGIGLGMVGAATGNGFMAAAGYLGAVLHVFNHFTFKSLLFYGAGVVYASTGTRLVDRLGGLVRALPVTAALFLVGSAAISGLPLLNGFAGELSIYLGLAHGVAGGAAEQGFAVVATAIIGLAGLSLIGATAVLCFANLFGIAFLGGARSAAAEPAIESRRLDRRFGFRVPPVAMALLALAAGLGAPFVVRALAPLVTELVPGMPADAWSKLVGVFASAGVGLALFAALIIAFWVIRRIMLAGRPVERFKTWDCGYPVASPRLQYTGSSFVSMFLGLTAGAVPSTVESTPPDGFFPQRASLRSRSHDLIGRYVIDPAARVLGTVLAVFRLIQSGKTQQYVLYGLLFLVILVIVVFGVRS